MEQNEPFDHRQSLGLIEQMIQEARNEHRERGDGWLIWGWLLFAASLLSAALMYYQRPQFIGWVWTSVLAAGLLIGTFLRFARPRQTYVTSYAAGLLQKLGAGFFISLFALIAASYMDESSQGKNGFSFGYYYILYAFWMFIYGSALKFRPLLAGAVVNWAAALCIFLIKDFFYAMLISSVAILAGYLIPGYILRNRYYKTASQKKVD